MNHQKPSYRTDKKQKHNLLPRYQNTNISINRPQQISPPSSHDSSHSSQSSHSSHDNQSNIAKKPGPKIPPKLHHLNIPSSPTFPSSPTSLHHQPSLPHLMRPSPKIQPKSNKNKVNKVNKPPNAIQRAHSHDTKNKPSSPYNREEIPLFHEIQHDINAYIQKFLFYASKRYWYSNEYSATRDMISCTPLSTTELFDIHKKAYSETILNDNIRRTSQSYIYMIDARIGATFDKIYNGIYGIYQTFIDKNNHISYIYNDKIINDKLTQINILNIISSNLNWNDYSNKLIKEINKQLLGPYKSYSLDKFTKLLQREYRTLSIMIAIMNRSKAAINNNNNNNDNNKKNENNTNSNRNKKGHLISLLQQQINHSDDDDDDDEDDSKLSVTTNNGKDLKDLKDLNETVAINKMSEYHVTLIHELNIDKKELIKTNNGIINIIKNAAQNADSEKSSSIKLEIENYIKSANDILTPRNKSYNLMKKYLKCLFNLNKKDENNDSIKTKLNRGKILMDEIDDLLLENKKLILYGKQLLDYKYECIAYNENLIKLKKEFHGKNKRFKKEIKDRITIIKDIDLNLNEKESSYLSISAKISSIIRFSAHNIKAGTMEILKTMLNNVSNMAPPRENEGDDMDKTDGIDQCELYECNLIHESVVLELEKQVDLCDKLLFKLQDYSMKKQRKLHNKMKQIGMLGGNTNNNNQNNGDNEELEDHEYHADDIIFRVNETGQYEKKFLMVIWKNKIYRVYESELSFQNRKQPIIENNFRATDYGYNGHLTIDVKRSAKSKKTSIFKGYQFILNKHAFVVKDMLDIKYWRNYIQRGENMRKASQDWEATNHLHSPKRIGLRHNKNNQNQNNNNNNNQNNQNQNNDENNDYNDYNNRDRKSRFLRKTRSSSLV